jgi:hypothetical protein
MAHLLLHSQGLTVSTAHTPVVGPGLEGRDEGECDGAFNFLTFSCRLETPPALRRIVALNSSRIFSERER